MAGRLASASLRDVTRLRPAWPPPARRLRAVRARAAGSLIGARREREAVLCQRFRAHDAAITSCLVLADSGGRRG
jgi:hypothetical protein